LDTLSTLGLVLLLAGLATGCELIAGLEDFTYVPTDAFAIDQGSSGSSQAPSAGSDDESLDSSQTLPEGDDSESASDDAASESPSHDATSDNPSHDAMSDSSPDDATSESRSHDAAFDALDPSRDANSGMSNDSGSDATRCSNPLGAVWNEIEAHGACVSKWTRQGSTSMFTDQQGAPCNVTASLTITLSGSSVSVSRTNSSDSNDCTYTGMLSSDCSSATGTYTCTRDNGVAEKWSATIAP
jgi:hypothetical protein